MEILKHRKIEEEKEESGTYVEQYLIKCLCGCEFIADWNECSSLDRGLLSQNIVESSPKIAFVCPECGKSTKFPRMSPIYLHEFHK